MLWAEEQAFGHLFLLLPVLIGTGAVIWFGLAQQPSFWPLLGAWSVALAIAAMLRHRPGAGRYLSLAVLLVVSGMLLAALETWRNATVVLDQPVTTTVTGVIETRESSGNGRWRYLLAVETTASPTLRRPPQRVTLLARGQAMTFQIGERIAGRARLSPPSGPALPGLADFAFSSYFDGIGAVGYFYGAPTAAGSPATVDWRDRATRAIFALRGAIADRIRATVPGDAGAFAAAIVTDERRAISQETTEALRLSGLAHIVAISGLNMALAAGIFFVGMRSLLSLLPGFAQAFAVKKIAAAAALVMATCYYLISGFGVSAERAYVMMAIMLVAVFFDRPAISLRNVALSALVIIAVSPSEILGPSFQMSFAATVALVAGYSAWSRREVEETARGWRPPALRPLLALWQLAAGIFVTSLIGGVSTAIFSVEHFHRLTSYGLAANLAAMPIVSFVVMPFGLVGMLLMPVGLDAPFITVMGWGLDAVIMVAKTVAGWGGDVGIGRQHPWFLPLATTGFLILTLSRTRLRLLGLPFLALAIMLSWQFSRGAPADLLIAEDGSLAALVHGSDVTTNRTRPPDFIFSQWKRALLLSDPAPPQMTDDPHTTKPKRPATPSLVSAAEDAPDRGTSPAKQKNTPQFGNRRPAPSTQTASPQKAASEEDTAANPPLSSDEQPISGAAGPSNNPRPDADSKRQPLTQKELTEARNAMKIAASNTSRGTFTCAGRSWCIAQALDGPIVALVEDARFVGPACDSARLVIAARSRLQACRSGALLINGQSLRRTGSLEIRFYGSADPQAWRAVAGFADMAHTDTGRPWSIHRQYDWREDRFDQTLPEPIRRLIGADPISGSGE